jgi:hypothetical protein
MSEWVQLLKENLDAVPAKDREFATSLLNQADKGKALSEKQNWWVCKLASAALGIPDFTRPAVNVGEFTAVIDLFKKASASMLYPRIVLKTEGGQKVALSLTTAKSKYPNCVNVTDGGGYGESQWFGRVEANGKFICGFSDYAKSIQNDVTSILAKLAAAPHRVAAEYGKSTKRCCFCHAPLSDENSLAVGYGSSCAKSWGLPWGVKKAA